MYFFIHYVAFFWVLIILGFLLWMAAGVGLFVFRVLKLIWILGLIAGDLILGIFYRLRILNQFGRGFGAHKVGELDRVIDGDTVVVDGKRIRIAYIDAPESGQRTLNNRVDAGWIAKKEMERFLANVQHIEIKEIDTDVYGRIVAQLWTGAIDVGLTFVALGLADVLPNAPTHYFDALEVAKNKKRGFWADGGFMPPDMDRILNDIGIHNPNWFGS